MISLNQKGLRKTKVCALGRSHLESSRRQLTGGYSSKLTALLGSGVAMANGLTAQLCRCGVVQRLGKG